MTTRPPPDGGNLRHRESPPAPDPALPDGVFRRHPQPMLLVDDAARILRANDAASEHFEATGPGGVPLLTRGILGCPAARGSGGGCAPGEPCAACELREMVLEALATGEDRGPEDLPLPFDADSSPGPLRASVTILEVEDGRRALVTFDDAATHRRLLRELHRRDEAQRDTELALRHTDTRAQADLGRLLRASAAVQEAATEQEILELVAGAVRETGWNAVAVHRIDASRIVASAHAGMDRERIRRLGKTRPGPEALARLTGPERDRFRVSRSYLVPAEARRPREPDPAQHTGPRPVRREDSWHPDDAAYVPMYGLDGELAGVINLDDPVDGRRPNEAAFRYLEFFGDLATRAMASLRFIRGMHETRRALHESESRCQSFVNVVSDVLYRYDPARNEYDFISPSVEQQTGYRMDEVCEDPRRFVRGITHPDDLDRVLDKVYSHVDRGPGAGPITMSYRIRRADGETRWVSDTMAIEFDERGALHRLSGVITDITERKQAERALLESQERVRALSDASFEAIFFSDKGVCLEQNLKAEKMFGYTSEESVGKTSAHWVAPEDQERVARHISRGFEGPYRITAVRKDGHRIPCEIRARTFEYRGRTVRVTSVVDITERQAAESARRESERRFRAVFETAADAIFLKDTECRYVLVNPVVEEMHGLPHEEIRGRTDAELLGAPWAEHSRATDERVLRGETVEEDHVEPVHGRERLLHVVKVPMFDEQGRISGLCGVARDITDRRRLEEELARADKLDSIGVLAGGIAHDFNNILTATLGNLSLARLSSDLSPEVAELLREAEEASLRARGLTQQLLTFSKGGAPILEILSPVGITRDVATFTLRGSNVKCEFDFADDCRAIEADPGQWNQVVSNLVLNADQAMPGGGRVALTLRNVELDRGDDIPLPPGRYVRLTVRDHGVGIPEEHLRRVFDPFFTTKQRGNGLGLSSVHAIVRRHRGHVSARSDPGWGTEMTVHLPAADRPAAPHASAREGLPRGSGHVLVMDDQEGVRRLAQVILERQGYDVVAVDEGAKAVRRHTEAARAGHPFDLLILDLTVPGGMGGLDALKRIRTLDPGIRAIVSSGYSTDPVMADHRDAGFQGRVAKPYQASDLLLAVADVLSGEAPADLRR
ncbi:PAS domain S-box protein [bacterium]|nr:PAS domain S-box protein [bacterium]